jgi:hypothetical protein
MPKPFSVVEQVWNAEIDGPFSWRYVTTCEQVNALLRATREQEKQALASMLSAVESVCGKLTKHRRAKLERELLQPVATLAGVSFQNGALARKAEQAHTRSGSRYEQRDADICAEMLKLTTRTKNPLPVEQAAAAVAGMNDSERRPRFTDRDDGENRLDEGAVKAIFYRRRPSTAAAG